MEQVDYNVDDFNGRFAGDRSVNARFYTMPMPDRAASAEAGRPMFRDVEFVEIVAAGNANNIVQRKVTDEDRHRFARQYEMFRQGHSDQVVGTPLTEVAFLTRSQVEELAYMRIRSLEALADLDDNVCSKHAGLYDLKKKAKAAVDQAAGLAPITQLQEENAQLRKMVEELQAQMKAKRAKKPDQSEEEQG